ncbi:alpha/beta hydrolase family protein [Lentzea atacamensis]|uniref:Alpha/beta hydrolase family protein n=1 Tax=Lentzea atacamensis TaxID=531938 RepID=A0ABX9EHU3_9PSEU|nr:alpha/beta fold hydrolase [Lentzea atacamensis]RAS70745.1 alpha/beta hydrolase family protein [Lentzea atacamensis]
MRLIVLGAVVALVVVPAPVAQAEVPPIEWTACGPEHPGFECATVTVPLDHDHPRGAATTVALTRKPATDKARRIGSLLFNPGGPGASGIEYTWAWGAKMSAGTEGRFDIVGFDPRGIGRSNPLRCFANEQERAEFLAAGPIFPYAPQQERPFFDRYRSLASRCDQPIARHMSTADVARDMDLLRRALGDRKITYFGTSYGSYLGTTYANMFPGNIRALAIDGVLNPELWSSGRQIESDRVAAREVLDEFFRLCDEAACAFGPDSKRRWEALLASVRVKPIQLGGEVWTYDRVIERALFAGYASEAWTDIAATLDQLSDASAGVSAAAAVYDNFFDANLGNMCADIEFPRTFGAYRAVSRYAAAGSEFGPYWWWSTSACADWPVNSDRYTGPWRAATSAPVLVVGNHFDGSTDFRGAQAVARQLPNSRLLAYAGWGHIAYRRSQCAIDHIHAYLLNGTLPAPGTVCPANPNPFLDPAHQLGDQDFRRSTGPVAGR